MIVSFADPDAEELLKERRSKAYPGLQALIRRKLIALDAATRLDDPRIPSGNRLEARKGDRRGQHSLRINQQYRIRFRWEGTNAHEVEIADYR